MLYGSGFTAGDNHQSIVMQGPLKLQGFFCRSRHPGVDFLGRCQNDRYCFGICAQRSNVSKWDLVAWILDWKSEDEAIEWVKRCPNPMPGPFDIEIRQLFEIEDFAEDTSKLDSKPPVNASQISGEPTYATTSASIRAIGEHRPRNLKQ